MSGRVDSRELRRFVVRISGPAGNTLGTGVFAAPGWVVTCAHVVGALSEAVVTPADPRVPLEPAAWPVVARSDPPPPGWRSAFWPFPDLAVLKAGSPVEHPCPLLEARDPVRECYSWGFPQVEQGVEPPGGPASFDFEGVTGGGFLQLKAGQAAPGISGSPLVCPSLRAVVGVVAVSRNTSSALGGWASPLSALLAGADDVPGDLAKAGEEIRQANRAAVIRYRREWNAVLPVDAGDALDQPWAEFTRGPRSVPSSLLRADYGVVPYLFRDAELDAAAAWCERADWARPMTVMRVAARGGAGKTRFAIELCKRLGAAGWAAGLWHGNGHGLERLPAPRLVIIDYAEEAHALSLRDSLDALARHATGLGPVQVLLLTRARIGQGADALTEIESDPGTPATLRRVLDHAEDNPVASLPLTPGQRETLYREAFARFAEKWCSGAATGMIAPVTVPDLSHPRYEVTLEVLFEALAAAVDQCGDDPAGDVAPDDGSGGGRPPAERVLAHEEKYWRLTAPEMLRSDVALLRQCAGLATLAGAGSQQEADALLSIPARLAGPDAAPARRMLTDWLSSMYDGPALLNPVRPDRLGEELVRQVLSGQDDGGQAMIGAVLALQSDAQVEQCLDVLARLASHPQAAGAAAAVLVASHRELVARCADQARATPERPGRVSMLGSLTRLHAAVLTDSRVAGLPADDLARLSVSFDSLGDLARQYGYGSQAQAIFEGALAIDRRRADAEPGNTTYARDLSISFNKLADLAAEAGQGERARELYQRSLEIRQQLADAEPGNTTYARDLSVSFDRLADLARQAGQGERARELYQRSLEIRQQLADAEPGNTTYARDLSISFERLADLARQANDRDQAKMWISEALGLRRELARSEPLRLDLAEELAYVLYMSTTIGADPASAAGEAARILEPFARLGYVTPRAQALLNWALDKR